MKTSNIEMILQGDRVHNNAIGPAFGLIASMFGPSSLPVSGCGAETSCGRAEKSVAAVPKGLERSQRQESSTLQRAHKNGIAFAPREEPEPILQQATAFLWV